MHKSKKWARGLSLLLVGIFSFTFLFSLVPQKAAAAGEKYRWVSRTQIVGSKGGYGDQAVMFTRQGDSSQFNSGEVRDANGCSFVGILSVAGSKRQADLNIPVLPTDPQPNSCPSNFVSKYDKNNVNLGNVGKSNDAPVEGIPPLTELFPPDEEPEEGGGGERDETCESEGGPLSWFACPILYALDGAINLLNAGIEELLDVEKEKYNHDNVRELWAAMRNIALLLLIPMMLLMVIGTALEFGPFDAYTVKKALPRMFLAVLFISLSLPITQFLINVSNVVGMGLEGLMESVTRSPDSLTELYSREGGVLFTTMVVTLIGVGALTGAITLGILGSLALVTFVALLIGYLVLVVRELLILILIIVAPLAILVWIFPDNDKLWKIWKATFIALLMMFPIIILLITSGNLFAGLISDVENDFTAFFLKIIAFIAPYFFIPMTFKYGLGVFGNIAGVINDRSRGFFDRNRKYRQTKRAEEWQKAKEGSRFNNRGLNALTSRATTRRLGFSERGRQAYQQKMNNAGIAFGKSEQAQGVQFNDNALRAMTYGSAAQARANMAKDWGMSEADVETSIAGAQAAGGFGRNRQVWATEQLSRIGTGYDNIEQVGQTIARAANGNSSQAAALAGSINSSTKQAGRYDLAPGFGNLNGLAQAELSGSASAAQYHAATVAASRGADPVTILRGKPTQVKNLTKALDKHLEAQTAIMTNASLPKQAREDAAMEVKKTIGQIRQLDQSKSYGSADNQMAVNELVLGSESVVGRALEELRAQPNSKEHAEDLTRFSAAPRFSPDDPRTQKDD